MPRLASLAAVLILAPAAAGAARYAAASAPASSPAHRSLRSSWPHRRIAAPRLLWSRAISPNADSAPVYASHPGGATCPTAAAHPPRGCGAAAVYILAGNNTDNCNTGNPVRAASLYTFNAASGRLLWRRSTTGPSRCTTAAPVLDPTQRWVYAAGLDGRLHRYDAVSGRETTGSGWPHTITLMPDVEKMSANLTITGHYLYITTSGFIGDQGHYEGHLVTIDLRTERSRVFNSLCSNIHALLGPSSCSYVESGLFGRGQGVTDPVTHDVYVVSGNGPWNGRTNWGDSILKLDPSGSRILDAFTPTNQQDLDNSDEDLGSTGPALLPTIRQGSHSYHLLLQGGKGPACGGCSGVAIRLLNRDNLSGQRGPGHLGGDLDDAQAPGGCEVLTAPAVWKQGPGKFWIFYANDCGVAGYRLASPSPGKFRIDRIWAIGTGGTTPVISGGVLYVAHSGAVVAYDPGSGRTLWNAAIGDVHWEYPLIAAHRLYVTDQSGKLHAFALK